MRLLFTASGFSTSIALCVLLSHALSLSLSVRFVTTSTTLMVFGAKQPPPTIHSSKLNFVRCISLTSRRYVTLAAALRITTTPHSHTHTCTISDKKLPRAHSRLKTSDEFLASACALFRSLSPHLALCFQYLFVVDFGLSKGLPASQERTVQLGTVMFTFRHKKDTLSRKNTTKIKR